MDAANPAVDAAASVGTRNAASTETIAAGALMKAQPGVGFLPVSSLPRLQPDSAVSAGPRPQAGTQPASGPAPTTGQCTAAAPRAKRPLPDFMQPSVLQSAKRANVQDAGSALPPLAFAKGTRKYIVTQIDAQAKATELANRIRTERKRMSKREPQYTVAVGFDIEWRVMYVTGQAPRPVALLQLALLQGAHQVCFLFQVVHCGFPEALCAILRDPTILKCGVSISADIHKLQRDFPAIEVDGGVELATLFPEETACSLAALVASQLGRGLPKTPHIRTGNWEALPLSEAQLDYAAKDALASILLFRKAEDNGATAGKSPDELALATVAKVASKRGLAGSLPAKVSTIRSTAGGLKSKFVVHDLMQTGQYTVEEVAAMRNIKPSTAMSYLADCITAGRPYEWARLGVSDTALQAVVQHYTQAAQDPEALVGFSLKKFKLLVEEALQDEVGYGVITLCLAHMHRQAAASAPRADDDSAAA